MSNYNHNFYGPDPRIHQQQRDLMTYRDLTDRIENLDNPDPIADTAWIPVGSTNLVDADEAPPLLNSWKTYNHDPLMFRLDANGRVWFRGRVFQYFGVITTASIFTLPSWARPQFDLEIQPTGGLGRTIKVTTAGAVSATSSSVTENLGSYYITFEGLHYRAWQRDEDEDFGDGEIDGDFAFFDDFETGDTSMWDDTSGGLVVSGSQVFAGSFSLELNNGDFLDHFFPTPAPSPGNLNAQTYVYIPQAYFDAIEATFTFSDVSKSGIFPIYFFDQTNFDFPLGCSLEFYNFDAGSGVDVQAFWAPDTDSTNFPFDGIPLVTDQWLKIELQGFFDPTDPTGQVQGVAMQVDDVSYVGTTNVYTYGIQYLMPDAVELAGGFNSSTVCYVDNFGSVL